MAKQQGELGAGVGEIRGETEGLWYRASWCVVSIKQAPSRDLNRHFLPPPVLAVETAGEHGGAGDADSALSSSGGHELIKKIRFFGLTSYMYEPGGCVYEVGFFVRYSSLSGAPQPSPRSPGVIYMVDPSRCPPADPAYSTAPGSCFYGMERPKIAPELPAV
jgi:hypothetical protein